MDTQVRADQRQTPMDFVREVIAARQARLCSFAAAVRAGDVEAVHDMRVASRRLRAAVKTCRGFLDAPKAAEYAAEVRGVTQALGRPRELDVMLAMLEAEEARASGAWHEAVIAARQALHAAREAVSANCAAAADAVERLSRWDTDALMDTAAAGGGAFGEEALGKARRKLKKMYHRWRHSKDDEHLHALRVAFKQMRYTLEIFAAPGEDATSGLKAVQQALGGWNDNRVLLHALAGLSLGDVDGKGVDLMLLCFQHRAKEHMLAFEMQVGPVLDRLLTERRQIDG